MPILKDLTGLRFSRLFVVCYSHKKGTAHYWRCRCDCGITKDIAGSNLKSGNTQSCGCLKKEKVTKLCKDRSTHGMRYTRLYNTWRSMKKRCLLDYGVAAKNYKQRGIFVCKEWLIFENFRDWSRINGYADNLTIDRINNDDGYYPENCRWITQAEQARNTRRNVLTHSSVTAIRKMISEGKRNCEISKIIGCHQRVISDIRHNRKWKDAV